MNKKFGAAVATVMGLMMAFGFTACGGGGNNSSGGGSSAPPERDPNGTYTYRTASSVFPTNWNPHVYQTTTDGELLDYMMTGFYSFDYNDAMDGYKMVDELATGDPVDVTSQHATEDWEISADDESRAWKITIRDDIKWNDGTSIKAEDFVESLYRLLDPRLKNYRADTVYANSLVIHNAKDYLYNGDTGWYAADLPLETYTESLDSELVFSIGSSAENEEKYNGATSSIRSLLGVKTDTTAEKVAEAMIKNGLNVTKEQILALEGKTLAEIKADSTLKATWDSIIGWWKSQPNEELDFFVIHYTWPEIEEEEIGIKAVSDYELVLILDKPLSGFYLKYALTSSWLVKTDLYDSCMKNSNGVWSNNYGTSDDTTASYGPYMLTSFQQDKAYALEKNKYFYGYNDPENEDLYWTTNITCTKADPTVQLQMFLRGELDSYGLQANDMEDYQSSSSTYYATGESTFFMALNPHDVEVLGQKEKAGTDKQILSILEFRQALSFALNREKFALAVAPTNNPAFGVFSNLIVADPETGMTYRTTDEAKDVLVNFWGLQDSIGEGNLYETVDDAIEAITGYNLDKAKGLFDTAYNKAIELGYMSSTDKVEICIGLPANTEFYTNGYNFLVNNYTEAVKGTNLEGKLTFTSDNTIGNDFATALQNNQIDLLFGVGWSGSALDPYNLITAYTTPGYQYDPSWNTAATMIDIEIDGKTYTGSVLDWSNALNGAETAFTVKDSNEKVTMEFGTTHPTSERLPILAALENAVLQTYDMIPILDQSQANLKSYKVNYATEEYVFGMGFGGLKYYTYNYTDEEWTNYVSSQGGSLNYK